jgi:hypothetical protein
VLNTDNTIKIKRVTTIIRIETNFFRKSFILKAQQIELPCKMHCYLFNFIDNALRVTIKRSSLLLEGNSTLPSNQGYPLRHEIPWTP